MEIGIWIFLEFTYSGQKFQSFSIVESIMVT